MNYSGINFCDIANGKGIRVSLFVSGCHFHCDGCFNPEAWDYEYGKPYTKETENKILEEIKKPHIRGLSILGGDPLCQSYEGMNQLFSLANKVNELGKNTWIWTAYTWEELMEDETEKEGPLLWQMRRSLVLACDVWVDGRFILNQKDLSLAFRGSKNQRVIDIKKSLEKKEVVTLY